MITFYLPGEVSPEETDRRDRQWERSTRGKRIRTDQGVLDLLRVGLAYGDPQPYIGMDTTTRDGRTGVEHITRLDITLEQARELSDALRALIDAAPPLSGG